MSYTKGPWEMERNNVHAGQIAVIHGCLNQDWVEIWSTNWPENEEVQEANAHLISASPDLLEALKHIEEYWNRDQNETAMADALWHIIETAQAAIAKAKGER
ncbi:MAG: hypothetical protein M0Q43_10330 [Methanothrix sp.]|jgi:hypothetical protein|nr:hypothetical protein [Methanothrix sp.]